MQQVGSTSADSAANISTGTDTNGSDSSGPGKADKNTLLKRLAVVKRNGTLVPFRRARVERAIEAAFRATKAVASNQPLPVELYQEVQKVTEMVVDALIVKAADGHSLTVEGVQDMVELQLMDAGHHDVAKNYIIYRDQHKKLRQDSPQNLFITRRDGKEVKFKPLKIASAIEDAFRAAQKIEGSTPSETVNAVNLVTARVVTQAADYVQAGQELHVELMQDEIERQLMSEGFFGVAKDFIIYRSQQNQKRAHDGEAGESRTVEVRREVRELGTSSDSSALESAKAEQQILVDSPSGQKFIVTSKDGSTYELFESEMRAKINYAGLGLEKVNTDEVADASMLNFYEGVKENEIDKSSIMAAKARIEKHPEYSTLAANLLLDVIYRETMGIELSSADLEAAHKTYFKQYLDRGIAIEQLNPQLKEFDLDKLASAIDLSRDRAFTYLGLQTLYDRYFIHEGDVRLETPQIFWMRVAMGLSMNEGAQKEARAIEFYNVLSQFYFMSSTPTLFNSGTTHPQLSSCYLSTVMDDLGHIFKVLADDAQLSKWAGGLGNDWTNVRATGSRIKGTNGLSQGVIPFLKVANDTAGAVNQGGKRKGAMCAYLETWHLDIEDFLELRKNTGDERRRTHDMNTANWIPDLFMKRVMEKADWTLFSPSDVPDLHDLYGKAFEERYEQYERMAEAGEIELHKKVEALTLWRKMLSMLFETGHPWITFKDPSNIRSPQDHVGVVHSSNLCTEILLNTSTEETAVCNLGSVNLARHITPEGIDHPQLKKTVSTAIRMLDNVIDINFYPTSEARSSNLKHRPIGLGIMGFQDALYIKDISYASHDAIEISDAIMEAVSYYAIMSSTDLAAERGTYESYEGSKWSKGILPIDSLDILAKERGGYLEVDRTTRMDWDKVRDAVRTKGMRNSNTMAIAPTATISNITGVTQSIEPMYKHLFVKSNLSGEFTIANTYLIEKLEALGLWDAEMIDDLKYFDGSVLEIERIPEEVKQVFLSAFEIESEWIMECASRRQKWIDMGQSLNLYMSEPSGKKLHDMYTTAWLKGLKTTYYLRSLGATQIEKSTTDINRRGLQPRWMKSKSASSNIVLDRTQEAPKPEVVEEGGCESCQ